MTRTPRQSRLNAMMRRRGLRVGNKTDALTEEHVRWLADNIPSGGDGKPALTISEYLVALLNDAMAEDEA